MSNFSTLFSFSFEKIARDWMPSIHGPKDEDTRSPASEMEGPSTIGAFGRATPPTEGIGASPDGKRKDVTQDWLEAIGS